MDNSKLQRNTASQMLIASTKQKKRSILQHVRDRDRWEVIIRLLSDLGRHVASAH